MPSGEVKNVLPKEKLHSRPKGQGSKRSVILISLGVLIIIAGVFGFAYFRKTKEDKRQAEVTEKAKEETQKEEAKKQLEKSIEQPKSEEVLEKTKDWQSYENKLYKYKAKFPKNWFSAPENKEDSWIAYFTNYQRKELEQATGTPPGARVEILVQGNPRNLSLSDWIAEGHLFSGEPKSSEELTVSGLSAVREEVDFEGMMTTTVYFFRGNDVVTLSYTGKEPDYNDNKEIFDLMIKSFEIEK
jgi:hypothetical protein